MPHPLGLVGADPHAQVDVTDPSGLLGADPRSLLDLAAGAQLGVHLEVEWVRACTEQHCIPQAPKMKEGHNTTQIATHVYMLFELCISLPQYISLKAGYPH